MALRVSKLSKRYGDKWALRDVGFEVAHGEIFGIFGELAAGKSTLLKCISGVEKSTGGDIFLDEIPLSTTTAKARAVRITGLSKSGGLGSLFGRESSVSAGEARLTELREALITDKMVLLLDDPFLSISNREREALAGDIRRFADRGNVVILASSTFEDIAVNCERMAVLAAGEIHQIDTPQRVYDNPVSIAAVVGRSNLFAARRLSSTNADLPEFMSIDGGHRLFAHAIEKYRLGPINQNVTLAIRPEQVFISFGASFPEDNLLKAVVTRICFHGKTTLIELDTGGLRLEARVFRVVGLSVGEECMVSLPPERLQILRD